MIPFHFVNKMQLFSIKAFNFIIASAVIDTLYYSFKVLYLYKN